MCDSCNVMIINGVVCHEAGCPDAWRDEERECQWCGQKFIPEDKHQRCCSESCEMDYQGIPYEPEEDYEDVDLLVEKAIEARNDEWASRNMGPNEY